MVAGEGSEKFDLGISKTIFFYVVGFALAFEFLVVGIVGLAA
jgi:hypothetical protein